MNKVASASVLAELPEYSDSFRILGRTMNVKRALIWASSSSMCRHARCLSTSFSPGGGKSVEPAWKMTRLRSSSSIPGLRARMLMKSVKFTCRLSCHGSTRILSLVRLRKHAALGGQHDSDKLHISKGPRGKVLETCALKRRL